MGTPRIPGIGEDVTSLMETPADVPDIGADVSHLMGGPPLPGPGVDDEEASLRVPPRMDVSTRPTLTPDEITARRDIQRAAGDPQFQELLARARNTRPPRTAAGTLRDLGVAALNGAIGMPEFAVGLADLGLLAAEVGARGLYLAPGHALSARGGRLARALEQVGFQPAEAKRLIGDLYSSEAQKFAQQEVAAANGIVPAVKAAVRNPSVIAQATIESAPTMLGGAGVARGVMRAAPRIAPVVAGAIGEGAVTAGLAAEQARQDSGGELTPGQGALTAGSGAVTGALGLLGGRIAQQFGFADLDTMLASAAQNPAAQGTVAKVIVLGAVQEGLIEEFPQSVQEQVAQNLATGRPAWEHVAQEGVIGAIAGGVMGGGGQAVAALRPRRAPAGQPPLPFEEQDTESVTRVTPSSQDVPGGESPQGVAPPVGADVTDRMNAPEASTPVEPRSEQFEKPELSPDQARRDMLIAQVQAARAQGREDLLAFEQLQQMGGIPPELERRSATRPPPDEGMPDVPKRRKTDQPDELEPGDELPQDIRQWPDEALEAASIRAEDDVQLWEERARKEPNNEGIAANLQQARANVDLYQKEINRRGSDNDFRKGREDSSFAGTGKLAPGARMTLQQYAEHYEHKDQVADELNELNEQERGGKRLKKADLARRQSLADDLKRADKRAKFWHTLDTHYERLLDGLLAQGLENLSEDDLERAKLGAEARARLEGRAQAAKYFPDDELLDRIDAEEDRRRALEEAQPYATAETAMPLATLPKHGRVFEVDGQLYVRDWSNVGGGKLGNPRYNAYRVVPIEDYKGDVGPFTQEEHDKLRDSHTAFFYGREDDYETGEDLIAGAEKALTGDRIRGRQTGVVYSAGGRNYVATGDTLYVQEDPKGLTPTVLGAQSPPKKPEKQAAAPPRSTAGQQLPPDLRGAKPRFNIGPNSYEPQFESDVDLAAYILAQKTLSKRDADYLKFVREQTGLSEKGARDLGQGVKVRIKDLAKDQPPGALKVPRIWNADVPESGTPIEVPDGYRLQPASRVTDKEEARIHGGDYTAVAQRISPFSAVRGYGDTPEAAQRDALRRVGALEQKSAAPANVVSEKPPSQKPASEMSDAEIADAIMAELAAEQQATAPAPEPVKVDDSYTQGLNRFYVTAISSDGQRVTVQTQGSGKRPEVITTEEFRRRQADSAKHATKYDKAAEQPAKKEPTAPSKAWMNEVDIDEAVERFANDPVLGPAARYLKQLQTETNRVSDGWPYWKAPAHAAGQLMGLLHSHLRAGMGAYPRLPKATAEDVRRTLPPIKAFMTKVGRQQGIELPEIDLPSAEQKATEPEPERQFDTRPLSEDEETTWAELIKAEQKGKLTPQAASQLKSLTARGTASAHANHLRSKTTEQLRRDLAMVPPVMTDYTRIKRVLIKEILAERGESLEATAAGDTLPPEFRVGDRVTVDEGTGEIHRISDDSVRIALEPGKRLSNWIPKSRVTLVSDAVMEGVAKGDRIDAILKAARKPDPDIVPVKELKGSDDKWYVGGNFPRVDITFSGKPEDIRTIGYAIRTEQGTTVGVRQKTREEVFEAWKAAEDRNQEGFRAELEKMGPAELDRQFEFWVTEGGKYRAHTAEKPRETPASAPAEGKKPTIRYNATRKSIEIKFPEKPAPEVIARLHDAGYRWARKNQHWYKTQATPQHAETAMAFWRKELLGGAEESKPAEPTYQERARAADTTDPTAKEGPGQLSAPQAFNLLRKLEKQYGTQSTRHTNAVRNASTTAERRTALDAAEVDFKEVRAELDKVDAENKRKKAEQRAEWLSDNEARARRLEEEGKLVYRVNGQMKAWEALEGKPVTLKGAPEGATFSIYKWPGGNTWTVIHNESGSAVSKVNEHRKQADAIAFAEQRFEDHKDKIQSILDKGIKDAIATAGPRPGSAPQSKSEPEPTEPVEARGAAKNYQVGDPVFVDGKNATVAAIQGEDVRVRFEDGSEVLHHGSRLLPPRSANADLDARKAANKATRDALAKQLAKDLGTELTSGVNPEHVKAMVGIMRTYLDDGIVEFERAWRTFKAEYAKLAPMLERPFEIAWRMLRGEDKKVSDVSDVSDQPPATPPAAKGFAAEVTDGSGYARNALVFATRQEADSYAKELMGRWMAARDYRVIEVDEAPNYYWDKAKYRAVPLEEKPAEPPKEEAKPHQESAVSEEPPPRTGKALKFADLNGLFWHFAKLKLTEWPSDARELREMAKQVQKVDMSDRTDEIVDAVEGALNAHLQREIMGRDDSAADWIMGGVAIEKHMPKAWRSLEKTDLQQFSTPLPIAAAAQWAAQITDSDSVVLEPTAGTGNLVSLIPSGQVDARELSDRRVEVLKLQGFDATQGDYLQNMLLKETADVIITNPPWGKYSKGKYGSAIALDFTPVDVAERFIAKNVRDLKPNGRIVAVMPTTMMRSPGFLSFLRKHGAIRAIIQSPPNAYRTRATDVDSLLLVWDKGKTDEHLGGAVAIRAVGEQAPKDWKEYADLVGRIPARSITEGTRGKPSQEPAERPPAATAGPTATTVGGRRPSGGSGRPGGSERPADRPAPGVSPGERPAPVVAPAERKPPGPAARLAREDRGDPTRGLTPANREAYDAASASQHFAPYRLRTDLEGERHPKLVVEARALSGVPYPELTLQPTARTRAILKAGRVSIEQAEQALAAVQANVNHQHGYLVADNVGVGKSREIGLTLLELMDRAQAQGRELRLMVTTKNADTVQGLIEHELKQELLKGEEPPFEIVHVKEFKNATNKKYAEQGDYQPLPRYPHAIYVVDSYNLARYRQSLLDVGLQGVIGDEVHNYKNAGASVGATWQTIHGQIMLTVPRDQQAFAYFTATPAQSVYDYRYLYGLREWPVDGFDDWVLMVTGKIKPEDAKKLETATDVGANNPAQVITTASTPIKVSVGGDAEDTGKGKREQFGGANLENIFNQILTPAEAEQIPREWKVKGKFSSRDLWRAGTEFVVETRPLKAEHKRRYDQFAQLARDIVDAADRFGKFDKSGKRNLFGPTGMLQNASKRVQMQPAIEEAITIAKEQLAQGFQPVISLINVNEMSPEEGNIKAAIEQINRREVIAGDDGEIIDLGDIPEALIVRAELLERAKELGEFPSPVKMIEDAFGADNIALIIGDEGPTRTKLAKEFQQGKRKVAVISAAGTTGINLDHVKEVGTGAKGRRAFIDVQYEWSASNAVQRYGRVDRSSSITPPRILALNFGSASEKKFLATVANRMASLGALSKGGAESTGASALEEFEITGDDALQAARNAWNALPEEDKRLWRGSAFWDKSNPDNVIPEVNTDADMRKIQLALLWLPIDKANAYWEAFIEERARIRDAMGYASERRAKRYKGEILREVVLDPHRSLFQVKNENNERFGILQGLVMGDMPKLVDLLRQPGTGVQRRYVTFTANNGQVIAGLEIPLMRMKAVAGLYGKLIKAERLDTPEKVQEALHAGDKLELQHEGWTLRERQDGRIAIDGVKMADRPLVMKHGVGYSSVGNYWYVTDLGKFLERFPVKGPEVTVDAVDEDPDEDGELAMPAIRGGGARPLPRPTGTPKPFEPRRHRQGAVIAMLRKRLGNVPVSVGRLHSENAGIYKPDVRTGGRVVKGNQAIRLRYANSLFEAMHEFGHHIDLAILKIDRGDARWSPELIALGMPTSRPSYTPNQKRKEGAAEFFRLYIMDPSTAQREAPAYFAEFERRLNQPDQRVLKDALLEARAGAEAFLSQYQDVRGESRVRLAEEEPGALRQIAGEIAEDPTGAKEAIATSLMRSFIDDLQPLKLAVRKMAAAAGKRLGWAEDAYVLARLARGSAMKAEAFLHDGVRGKDGQFLGPSLQAALKLVGKKHYRQFGQYLVALRVLEVRERGIETGMKASEATAIIEKARQSPAFAQFEQARELVYGYQRALLAYMRTYGALNTGQVRAITKFAELYVPLQRVMDETTGYFSGTARRLVNRHNPIYRLLGSSRDIIDPFESIVKNTLAITDMVEKNKAAQALVELAEESPGSAKYLESLPAPQAATKFNLAQLADQIRASLDDMGLGDSVPDNFEDALQKLVTVFTPVHFARGKEAKENIVTVIRDGERQFWQIHDQALAEAIAQIGPREAGVLAQFGAFGKAADWVGQGATKALRFTATTTPTFMLRNLTRDTFGAFLQSRYGFIPVWDNIRVAGELTRGQSEEAKLFKAAGVQQATLMGYDRKSRAQIVKNMRDKRSLYHPIDLLRAASMFVESSTRFAEFKNALAAGGEERGIARRLFEGSQNRRVDEESLARAALAGRDVSTDFSRAGIVTREANKYWAFLNARVQGYARIAETIKRDPVGTAMKVGWLAAASWLLALANADDKEYEQKTESEKHAAWFWRVHPDQPFLEIQKPFEWGYVPDLVEATVEWLKRNDPTRFKKILAEWTPSDLRSAMLRVMPTVALPLLEANMNYSLFRGGPIVSPFDLDLPNDLIYNEWTSETAKLLGKVMDVPPAYIDHVLMGYTSTMGRETIATTDYLGGKAGIFAERNLPAKAIQQYPFFGAFLDDARFTGQAREIQDLYDAATEIEAIERGVRRDLTAGRREAAAGRVREALSESDLLRRRTAIKAVRAEFREIGKQLKAIHALPPHVASPQQKAAMIYRQRERMIDLAARALGRRELPSRKAANE